MYLEERLERLEEENEELKNRIKTLERKGADRFVTVGELAEMMGCSCNTIYCKIRTGEIESTRKTGDHRIPMSQFYKEQPKITKIKKEQKQDLKSLVLG